MAVVFIARTALTNCGYPVRRSILMDFVPKSRCVEIFSSAAFFLGGLDFFPSRLCLFFYSWVMQRVCFSSVVGCDMGLHGSNAGSDPGEPSGAACRCSFSLVGVGARC